MAMRTDGRTDGQKDMVKLIVVFRNFANAPKKRKKTVFTINQNLKLIKKK